MKESLRGISADELRAIQIEILKHFIAICKENAIGYYMAYGSLLGAVRHKGFIPWDDDVDVMVFREDLPKLIEAYNNNDKYGIINSSINSSYFSPLVKVFDKKTLLVQEYGQVEGCNIGVYIDVFILDSVPKEDLCRKRFYDRANRYRFQWALSCRKFTAKSRNLIYAIIKSIVSIPYRVIGFRHFARKYDQFAASFDGDETKAIVVYGEGFEKEYVYSSEELESIEIPFEGFMVCVPKVYDAVLTKCYGNYMELPPIGQRVSKHPIKAYWL